MLRLRLRLGLELGLGLKVRVRARVRVRVRVGVRVRLRVRVRVGVRGIEVGFEGSCSPSHARAAASSEHEMVPVRSASKTLKASAEYSPLASISARTRATRALRCRPCRGQVSVRVRLA